MYTFIKNKLFICPILLLLLISGSYSRVAADNIFSLKPIRPPGLNSFSRLLEKLQRSQLLRRIDAFLNFTGLYDFVADLNSPKISVIPPVAGNHKAKRLAKSDNEAIKALSANMLLFPAPFFFNQEQRIAEFVRYARQLNPSIIFLQEVWDNRSMSLLIAEFPDYYSIFMPGIGYNFSGLLILSRYPVRGVIAKRFAVSLKHSIEELVAQKGFLLIETARNGQSFYLLNTHLYSADASRRYRPNLIQFEYIADVVKNLPAPAIIGGDMNLLPADLDARRPSSILRDNCNLPTAGFPKLSQKLDYILIKPDSGKSGLIKSRRIDTPVRFSDHSPIYAEIYFR